MIDWLKSRPVLAGLLVTFGCVLLTRYLLTILEPKLQQDSFLWLEALESDKALAWVEQRNQETKAALVSSGEHKALSEQLHTIYTDADRLPFAGSRGKYFYNFWRDKKNPQGLWRRTSQASYLANQPDWETVLDFDLLSDSTDETWVFQGSNCLWPKAEKCMLRLSAGGSDRATLEEFDTTTKTFVKDQPFDVPAARSTISWLDKDRLFIATDFGPGSMTANGFPRQVRLWQRGQRLAEAELIFTAPAHVVSVGATHYPAEQITLLRVHPAFWQAEIYLLTPAFKVEKLPLPLDISGGSVFKNQVYFVLKKPWQHGAQLWPADTVLAYHLAKKTFSTVFQPRKNQSIQHIQRSKNSLHIHVLENVVGRIYAVQMTADSWQAIPVTLPSAGRVDIVDTDPSSEFVVFSSEGFLQPEALGFYRDQDLQGQTIRSAKSWFDPSQYQVLQQFAPSKDGTRIPYFLVGRKDISEPRPALLYGYGGFNIPMLPSYNPGRELAWLRQGHWFVLANIRGGGEFGSRWHEAARRDRRQTSYDDFIAIAEDLISKGITTSTQLGIMGGSNGGLLVGAVATQRPDLFAAVVCQVPLLDMKRFTEFPPGAIWVAEYGDPSDPEAWNYIKRYSPYHNIVSYKKYPPFLFVTSTKDDRVHPAHARKMAAKMRALRQNVYYFERTKGGHGADTNLDDRAWRHGLEYVFLKKFL